MVQLRSATVHRGMSVTVVQLHAIGGTGETVDESGCSMGQESTTGSYTFLFDL